jgi:hypothetical protein
VRIVAHLWSFCGAPEPGWSMRPVEVYASEVLRVEDPDI